MIKLSLMNTNQLSQANVEEELDRFIASKNLELYELVHKKGVPAVYNSLDPKIKTVYKMDALKQFVKNRKKRHSSNSNEKDPLQKAVPRISRAQLLVWELLKQVGKTYDDIFSEWYEASITTPTAPFVLPEKDENEIRLERLEEKIDYIAEKLIPHDRVPLEDRYSNLMLLTASFSALIKNTDSTKEWTENFFLLYNYYFLVSKTVEKLSKKNDIYKKYLGLYAEANDFNKYTLFIIYLLFLTAYFLNEVAGYTDSYKRNFNETDKLFDFELETDTESFRKKLTEYKNKILRFIDIIKETGINFNKKQCEDLYKTFKTLFKNERDLFVDKDGRLAESKHLENDVRLAVLFKKQRKIQYYMRIYISEDKKRQIADIIACNEKITKEVF